MTGFLLYSSILPLLSSTAIVARVIILGGSLHRYVV